MPLTEQEARERLEEEKQFYVHVVTFFVIMAGLVGLNLFTGTEHYWFVYPLLGWGLGLAGHAASVFGMPRKGSAWEARRLQELTGGESEEVRAASLRRLLDEELEGRSLSSNEGHSVERLQQRIEHLEAIVTSRDWDALEEAGRPGLLEAEDPMDDASEEERAARLARRVR